MPGIDNSNNNSNNSKIGLKLDNLRISNVGSYTVVRWGVFTGIYHKASLVGVFDGSIVNGLGSYISTEEGISWASSMPTPVLTQARVVHARIIKGDIEGMGGLQEKLDGDAVLAHFGSMGKAAWDADVDIMRKELGYD